MSTGVLDKIEHPWLPKTTCDERCVDGEPSQSPARAVIRSARRIVTVFLVLLALPLLAVPLPGRTGIQRSYCRMVLRSLGVRIRLTGNPIRNLPGVLVVSNHTSWVDVFAIGSVVPGSFVARADLVDWPAIGPAVRMVGVIPIERRSLRKLPPVVDAVTERLRQGRTVIAFPEGTTFCGRHNGSFRPAVFQASIDSDRPVQPVCLTYRQADGRPSTATAFLGDDSLWASVKRTVAARVTVVDLVVGPLELPGASRRELAARCQTALRSAELS